MENVEAAVFTPHCQELVYDWEGIPVLTCRLSLPQTAGEEPGLIRIDRYYRHAEDCIRRWLESRHAKLCTLAQDALCASRPIPTERVLVDYQAEQTESGLLDICWTVQWEGKRRRFLDCWEPKTGAPVKNVSRYSALQPFAPASAAASSSGQDICQGKILSGIAARNEHIL